MKSVGTKLQIAVILLFLGGLASWWGITRAQESAMSGGNTSATPWLPNKKNSRYAGPEACAKCHAALAGQHNTSMGKALEPAATSEILRTHPRLTFRSGPYQYEITRRGEQSIYSVTDGVNTFAEPILYSFGQGKAGQTYVFQHNGAFYESRLSYFRETQNLDWTIGYPRDVPPSLEVAAGRAISPDEARNCFACHSTAAANGTQLNLDKLIPGVSCEACHGPGADHIASMEAEKFTDKRIFNPGTMSPDELTQEFCGSCHRSAEQVASNKGLRGITSVRFQPYRLFTSKGHDPFDPRLSCTACHNPHEAPQHDKVFYDAKCFACHRSGASRKTPALAKTETDTGRTASACPVGTRLCVSCHMPPVEVTGSHFQFTDHRIRIAKPNEPFPN